MKPYGKPCNKCDKSEPEVAFFDNCYTCIPCSKAYYQARKKIMREKNPLPPPIDYLKLYTEVPETGCWLWLGRWDRAKYGKTTARTGFWFAHRLFYSTFKGDVPKGMCVCHKCDTPPCVNPDHLFLGTNQDNSDDMVAKGRHRGGRNKRFDKDRRAA